MSKPLIMMTTTIRQPSLSWSPPPPSALTTHYLPWHPFPFSPFFFSFFSFLFSSVFSSSSFHPHPTPHFSLYLHSPLSLTSTCVKHGNKLRQRQNGTWRWAECIVTVYTEHSQEPAQSTTQWLHSPQYTPQARYTRVALTLTAGHGRHAATQRQHAATHTRYTPTLQAPQHSTSWLSSHNTEKKYSATETEINEPVPLPPFPSVLSKSRKTTAISYARLLTGSCGSCEQSASLKNNWKYLNGFHRSPSSVNAESFWWWQCTR